MHLLREVTRRLKLRRETRHDGRQGRGFVRKARAEGSSSKGGCVNTKRPRRDVDEAAVVISCKIVQLFAF